jgi:hypothetical protein
VTPDIAEKSPEIRRLLKLPADGNKFTLIYSPSRGAAGELGVNSRSLMQIMGAFASYRESAVDHHSGAIIAACGRATAGLPRRRHGS